MQKTLLTLFLCGSVVSAYAAELAITNLTSVNPKVTDQWCSDHIKDRQMLNPSERKPNTLVDSQGNTITRTSLHTTKVDGFIQFKGTDIISGKADGKDWKANMKFLAVSTTMKGPYMGVFNDGMCQGNYVYTP